MRARHCQQSGREGGRERGRGSKARRDAERILTREYCDRFVVVAPLASCLLSHLVFCFLLRRFPTFFRFFPTEEKSSIRRTLHGHCNVNEIVAALRCCTALLHCTYVVDDKMVRVIYDCFGRPSVVIIHRLLQCVPCLLLAEGYDGGGTARRSRERACIIPAEERRRNTRCSRRGGGTTAAATRLARGKRSSHFRSRAA